MTVTATKSRAADDYLKLVRECPIRPLRTAADHAAAQKIVDRLLGRDDLTFGQRDYLGAIIHFMEEYEKERTVARMRKLTPIEIVRHLMEENEMSTSDLGYILGSRGLASEVLGGKRGLSKTLIRKLSARFGLPASLFLASDESEQIETHK